MNFSDMKLTPPILKAVEEAGYDTPTPIQEATIPLVVDGKDVLGCAQTGTGKTAAFALPILHRLSRKPYISAKGGVRPIRALILTPTRELAMQIYESFLTYGKHLSVRACVVFGGVNQHSQVEHLRRGVDVLVATPGRLNDLIGQGYIHLDRLEIFVLDEADRMLDMGFIHDVKRVIARLPEKRQTLLFSATMPEEVETLALNILTDPESVKVDPVSSTVDAIEQTLYYVDKVNKKYLLADLLNKPEVESALVFSRTKYGADRIARDLEKMGIEARSIHGDKTQNARQAALTAFKTGEVKVLVATDIAARGIDIAGLSHVFNYDMPNEAEAYVHRIGRTGRAGRTGIAISFCCIDELKYLNAVEKLIHKKIPLKESAWPMEVMTPSEPKQRGPRPEKAVKCKPETMPTRVDRNGNAVEKRPSRTFGPKTAKETEKRQPQAGGKRTPARKISERSSTSRQTGRSNARRGRNR